MKKIAFSRLVPVLGFALFWVWQSTVFSTWSIYSSTIFESEFTDLVYLASQIAALISASALILYHMRNGMVTTSSFVVICSLLLCLATGYLAVFPISLNSAGFFIASILTGLCFPPLAIAWGARFMLEGKRAVLMVAEVFLISALLKIVMLYCCIALIWLLPAFSVMLWFLDKRRYGKLEYRDDLPEKEIAAGGFSLKMVSWLPFSILLVAALMSDLLTAVMDQSSFASSQILSAASVLPETVVSAVLSIVLIQVISYKKLELDFYSICIFLLPLIVIILLASMFSESFIAFGLLSILRGGLCLFPLLIWVCLVDAARREGVSPVRALAFAMAVTWEVILVGNISSTLIVTWLGTQRSVYIVIAALEIMLLVSMFSFSAWLKMRNHPVAGGTEREPALSDDVTRNAYKDLITKNLELFAISYGLTAREVQIFSHLLKGDKGTYIAEQLFITVGTVKTHISHIYHKLGVGSRQEAVILFEKQANGSGFFTL